MAKTKTTNNATLTNPITGDVFEFDYNKVIEADNAPIDYNSISEFLAKTNKFYEDDIELSKELWEKDNGETSESNLHELWSSCEKQDVGKE